MPPKRSIDRRRRRRNKKPIMLNDFVSDVGTVQEQTSRHSIHHDDLDNDNDTMESTARTPSARTNGAQKSNLNGMDSRVNRKQQQLATKTSTQSTPKRQNPSMKKEKKGVKPQEDGSLNDESESFRDDTMDDTDDDFQEAKQRPPIKKCPKPTANIKKTVMKNRNRTSKRNTNEFISSTDEDDDDDDGLELFESNHGVAPTGPRQRKSNRECNRTNQFVDEQGHVDMKDNSVSTRQRRKATTATLTYAEIDHSDIDVEEAEIGNTPPKYKRYTKESTSNVDKPKKYSTQGKPSSRKSSTSSSSSDKGEDDVTLATLSKRNAKKSSLNETDEESTPDRTNWAVTKKLPIISSKDMLEDVNDERVSPYNRRGIPCRRAAERAIIKLAAASSGDEENFDDMPMLSAKKKSNDDEEFEDYQSAHESDDGKVEMDYYSGDSDDTPNNSTDKGTRRATANVDDDEIFDADESSGDEQTNPPMIQSPMLEIIPTPRKSRVDTSESDELDGELTNTSHRIPCCSSTCDAITMERLPQRHICFLLPDGQSRQCFALETLHKIAFSNSPCLDSEGNVMFKQPPHFRAGISDDLVDQIALKFGRSALDLCGDFYNRKEGATSVTSPNSKGERDNEFGYMVNFDGTLADNIRFNEMVDQYLSQYMGSKDIYCCPVCYAEAFRRLSFGNTRGFDPNDDSEGALGDTNTEFRDYDPISVLGSLDNDAYKLASTFCFRKLAEVKRHLRDDHDLDTKEVDGNDFYKRFQIRASDGLLQRHLDRRFRGKPKQGCMLIYWNEGNSEIFIYLLHLMERAKLLRDEAKKGNQATRGYEEAREFAENMQMFWDSFERRAKSMWELLASPYEKESDDINDFFANGDEEVDESHRIHINAILSQDGSQAYTPEEEIIAALKAKRACKGEVEGSSDSDDAGSENSDPEEDDGLEVEESSVDVIHPGYYSEDDEEQDDWMKEKLSKRKSKGRASKPPGKIIGAKKLGRSRKSNSIKLSRNLSATPSTLPSSEQLLSQKRRRITVESEDE